MVWGGYGWVGRGKGNATTPPKGCNQKKHPLITNAHIHTHQALRASSAQKNTKEDHKSMHMTQLGPVCKGGQWGA